jgi:hypothetical protein
MMKQEHVDLINELQDEIHLSFDECLHDTIDDAIIKEGGISAEENEIEYLNRFNELTIEFGKPLAIQLIKQIADLYELNVAIK